mmetsp:Transcript_43679/g.132884  ORF Transcript_43679/g.132884 Transcript_43679/m.132884 type:complete len:283 (+) Transcript_43679:1190-2038(+)
MAKNSPSFPVGASMATQDCTLGDQKTSPRVRATCQRHAPPTVGHRITARGDNAMTHIPGSMTRKFSTLAVSNPTTGGRTRHPHRLMDWTVKMGIDSPYVRSRKGGRIISDADHWTEMKRDATPNARTLHMSRHRRRSRTCARVRRTAVRKVGRTPRLPRRSATPSSSREFPPPPAAPPSRPIVDGVANTLYLPPLPPRHGAMGGARMVPAPPAGTMTSPSSSSGSESSTTVKSRRNRIATIRASTTARSVTTRNCREGVNTSTSPPPPNGGNANEASRRLRK